MNLRVAVARLERALPPLPRPPASRRTLYRADQLDAAERVRAYLSAHPAARGGPVPTALADDWRLISGAGP